MVDSIPAYRWLIAWLTLALILFALSKLKVGYIIEYYLVVLTLLLLLLTQYQAIAGLLSPFGPANTVQATGTLKPTKVTIQGFGGTTSG